MTATPDRRMLVNNRTYAHVSTGFGAWLAQRVAALLLLVLVPLKVYSGWVITGQMPGGQWLSGLHVNALVDILLMAAVGVHALYGLRTILIELGVARYARGLFVAATLGAVVIAAIGVVVSL